MVSTGVNVLRWSALGAGLFYGFSHQRSITVLQKAEHNKHEYAQKQKLIDQAKAEFVRQKNPASKDDVVMDFESPEFDMEKYLTKMFKENP